MNSVSSKYRDSKKLPSVNNGTVSKYVERDLSTQLVSKFVLNQIVQKAEYIRNRNFQVNQFIETEKLQQSQRFTAKTCTEVLQNLLTKPESLSPNIVIQNNLRSPSKTPYSFLNYDELSEESDNSHIANEVWEEKRNSTKLYNCNKIYIINKKSSKANTVDKNSTIKSIKLNDVPMASAFGRSSCKPQIKRVSINHSTLVPRLSVQGKTSRNMLSTSFEHINKSNFLQVSKTEKSELNRSSFHGEKEAQKKSELVKLQNFSVITNSQKLDQRDFETNEHIAFLRQRKEKLQNIMKVFDLDDQQKKNSKIEKQNSLKEAKTDNLAETLGKMPAMTTDYDGSKLYFQDPFQKAQRSQQNNSKREYIRLPKYEPHEEGVLSHNVNFKVKDFDFKTENLSNQIFSSFSNTPHRSSAKKITFNMKSVETSKKTPGKKNQKTQKNSVFKLAANEEDKNEHVEKNQNQNVIENDAEANNLKPPKNPSDHAKSSKSGRKLPVKSFRESQNSANQKNKQNLPSEKTNVNLNLNLRNDNCAVNRQKSVLKTEQSSRSNIMNKSSLGELETLNRQAYASHRERIHPNLAKIRKTTTKTTEENERNKINQSSNEANENLANDLENRPQSRYFSDFIESDTK